uniref:Bone morphogenetic protein 8a n=1 Tax=Callorhinchus milii TaxID=7868 RepID=A0A4W3HFZ5_CALMI
QTDFSLLCLLLLFVDLVNGSLMNQHHSNFIHRRLNSRERREMQKEILSILGLSRRPRPLLSFKRSASAPVFMLDLYRTMASEETGRVRGASLPFHMLPSAHHRPLEESFLSQADTIMSFVNGATHSKPLAPLVQHMLWKEFKFDLTRIPRGEMVTAAEFRIYKTSNESFPGNLTLHVTVYQVLQEFHDRSVSKVLGRTLTLFDITATSNDWLMNPHYNLGLRLFVETEGGSVDPGSAGLVGRRGPRTKRPFMVTFFRASQAPVRTIRAANRRKGRKKYAGYNGREQTQVCKRHDLYVSFRELDWQDWIIAPEGYEAFYCDGDCSFPLGSHMNASNHAIVQALVHLMKPDAVPKPCCAPTKLSATSVLYFDDKYNVILKKYRNMVAKSCGCQ